MKKVEIIPIIVRALGPVSKNVGKYVERTGIELNVEHAQKPALLGTARIFKVSARTKAYFNICTGGPFGPPGPTSGPPRAVAPQVAHHGLWPHKWPHKWPTTPQVAHHQVA